MIYTLFARTDIFDGLFEFIGLSLRCIVFLTFSWILLFGGVYKAEVEVGHICDIQLI